MTDQSNLLAHGADELRRVGVCVIADLFDDDWLGAVQREARTLVSAGELRPAATGRDSGRNFGTLRGDDTLWLDDPACGKASRDFLLSLDGVRVALNHRLMLGMESIEAHYALYPVGTGYVRHRDRFRDNDSRVLSLVCYLNRDWPDDAGGALRLHLADGIVDIAPAMGTTVIFLSGETEHEVLPAAQPRLSISAWFRRRAYS